MKIYIFGTSGFSREVADICFEIGYTDISFIENEHEHGNIAYYGFKIISETKLSELDLRNAHFSIGIGEPAIRNKIFEKFPYLNYPNIIHPSATFGVKMPEAISMKSGNVIAAGVRMTNNISVGNFGVYNLNLTIGHDCVIEDFVTISPGANISGNVHLKRKSYIGTNSTIIQGKSIHEKITIGENSIVGAGAVVTKNVISNVIVKGTPAR